MFWNTTARWTAHLYILRMTFTASSAPRWCGWEPQRMGAQTQSVIQGMTRIWRLARLESSARDILAKILSLASLSCFLSCHLPLQSFGVPWYGASSFRPIRTNTLGKETAQ